METKLRNQADKILQANKRGIARLTAVQALYQMDLIGSTILETVSEYETYRLGKEIDGVQYLQGDPQWFRNIVSGVVEEQEILEPIIRKKLPEDWPLSRLDSILRALLRAATWELKNRTDVPIAVVINEYIDIAKAFFEGEEPRMANALLDKLAKELRPKQR